MYIQGYKAYSDNAMYSSMDTVSTHINADMALKLICVNYCTLVFIMGDGQ